MLHSIKFYVYVKPITQKNYRMNIEKQFEIAQKTGCLCLSNMNLKFLPEIPDYVQELICDNNKLMALPTLPKTLRRLRVNNNYLKSLPKLPKSLLFLCCSNNKLSHLPALPLNILEIDCSVNQIRRLPKLPSQLYFFRVSHNRLQYLPLLPDSLSTPTISSLDLDKIAYIAFHNNEWNPLFEKYLAKGIKTGVQAYHADINKRLQTVAALQTLHELNDDVLACIGSFLTGVDNHTVNQTKHLLDMIE